MTVNHQRLLALAAVVIALIAGGCAAGGDAPEADGSVAEGEGPASPDLSDDAATVSDYVLTMDGVNRYFDATINVARAVEGMSPAERAAFEANEGQEEVPSLDDMVEHIESNAVVANAVRDAGLSPREYALIAMSMLQAGMAQAFAAMQPGANQDSLARTMGVRSENIAFMRDNAEELGRRQEEMSSAMEALEAEE